MVTIDKSFNGKKIQAQKGDIIKIQLAENPTTGYRWKISSLNDKHLNQTEEKYDATGKAVGAGGMKNFHFLVVNDDISELRITLSNTWENDSADTFVVTIFS